MAALAFCARGPAAEPGPAVARVDVEGHESLSTREVARIVVGDRHAVVDRDVLAAGADSLVSRLASLGRPFARVEIDWRDTAEGRAVTIRVDEGPRVTVDRIAFEGTESIASGRLDWGGTLRRGSLVTGRALTLDVGSLLTAYENNGRPFASVRPGTAELADDGAVALTLHVDEGPEAWFGDLVVSGNEVTKDRIVAREAGIKRGEPYSAARLDRVQPRLERLGIFEQVSAPVVAVDPATGETTVGIEVTEALANRITGVLGYQPSSDGDGELIGLVDVELLNIAGTGRQASARWENLAAAQTRISFSYLEPWLLGAPIDVGIRGAQTIRDTFYTTTEGDLLVTARMGERTRITWTLGAERYVPDAVDGSTTESYRTSLSAVYDGTDVPANPAAGIVLDGSLEYAAKDESDAGGEVHAATMSLGAASYLELRRRHVLALAGRLSGITSTEDDVPFHELLVLGGATSLRGYREEQFRGERTALGTLEYRVLTGRRSRVFAFVDVGFYFRRGSNSTKGTKLGYGIGLRGSTRLGIIGVDYGLGEGDGFLDGKLHVGLIREF